MRVVAVILAALAVAMVLATWLERSGLSPVASDSPLWTAEIRVTGSGNTLASIARRMGNPKQFSYDAATHTAVSHATLVIEGELQLGREGEADCGEILELATQSCGDLRIEVRPGGTLRLYNSTIRTVSKILSDNACSQGYALFVDGELTMSDSTISYISGSTSQCLRGGATAVIRNSVFSQCDGSALSCVNVDGGRITIEDSDIIGAGIYGLVVRGSGGEPLEVRNSVLAAPYGAVFMTGESARARLVDCTFDPSKIVFNRLSGEVVVAWTRRFKVIDAGTKSPRSGVLVRAKTTADSPAAETVESHTDAKGVAELVLTEWIARPGAVGRVGGQNAATPHRVSVVGDDDQVLAEMNHFEVMGKVGRDEGPVMIELP